MSYIIAFLLISLAIFIHELGHFIAAKLTGIPIALFCLGFGPPLLSIKRKNTVYGIALIPAGGYVLPEIQDEKEFFKIPVYKRVIFSIGGPLANVFLCLLCFGTINIIFKGFSLYNFFIEPFSITAYFLYDMICSIPSLFSHSEQVSGIVGAVAQGGDFISSPVTTFSPIISSILNGILFMATFSINLAVLNMLPIPVLDGGKCLLYLMEKIHPAFLKLYMPLTVISWIFIVGFMLYKMVIDIGKYVIGIFI